MKKNATARSLDMLASADILPAVTPELRAVAGQFSVAITPAMMALIDPSDPNDPIAAQFVPSAAELAVEPQELADPIGDEAYTPVKGVVHRYPDRALLKLVMSCPVNCRFCFRREMLNGPGSALLGDELAEALAYIERHDEIWEVILTGGDPLMLPDRHLADVVQRLNAIPHVKVVRLHTRIPVVDPARVTPGLVTALKGRAPVYVLLHCNHPRELTEDARAACARFVDAGIPMLGQSVLLRGVNDDAATLESLLRALVEIRVKPYYLHHPDLARGTGHFRVSLEEGQELMRGLRGRVSGLCQPTYVLDIPGGYGKVPVGPVYANCEEHAWAIKDYRGQPHAYKDSD